MEITFNQSVHIVVIPSTCNLMMIEGLECHPVITDGRG